MEGLQILEKDNKGISVKVQYGEAKLEILERDGNLVLKFFGKKPYTISGEIELLKEEVISALFGAMGIEKVKIDTERWRLIIEYIYDTELLKVKIYDLLERPKYTRYYLNPPHHIFFISALRNYLTKQREIYFKSGIFKVEIERDAESLKLYEGDILILERKGRDFRSLRAVLENSFLLGEVSFEDKLSRCVFFKEKKLPAISLKVWSVI